MYICYFKLSCFVLNILDLLDGINIVVIRATPPPISRTDSAHRLPNLWLNKIPRSKPGTSTNPDMKRFRYGDPDKSLEPIDSP